MTSKKSQQKKLKYFDPKLEEENDEMSEEEMNSD